MARKTKTSQPSLRDKLSAAYLEAFQKDFETNGVAVIEALRLKSPEKYSEIAARLIATTEPKQDATVFAGANSMEEVGRRILQSIGMVEPDDAAIAAAIEANSEFIAKLEAIRDRAVQLEGNGYDAQATP
jgi:ribosomal protein S17E